MCIHIHLFSLLYTYKYTPQNRWHNSKTKMPIRWHRAVRKKTALFWLEHKTSCAIYVACVKDPIEEKKRPKIAHFG